MNILRIAVKFKTSDDLRELFKMSSIILTIYTFIKNATLSYEYWWLQLFAESPQHILIETGLLCFIIWLLFIRRTVDPKLTSHNDNLSKKEIEELIESWEPEDIIPELSSEADAISDNLMTVEGINGNYIKIRGITTKVLNLCSFKETALKALEKYGCGSCGPRGFYGN